MSAETQFETFEQFWPFYVSEHAKKSTRWLHFFGTTAAMACAAAALLGRKRALFLMPLVGYTPAWIGHFFIEKNRPATLKNPVWSLRADLIMWSKMLAGTMDVEVDRVMAERDAEREKSGRDERADRNQTLN